MAAALMLWNFSHCIYSARAVHRFGLQVVLCNAKLTLAGVLLSPTVAPLTSGGITKEKKENTS